MQSVDRLILLEDKNELLYYLDYTVQLIEFYEKRDLCTKKLKEEHQLLENRIKELK